MDVGADFFSAADLAALKLKGLPARREHISRRASAEGWKFEERAGRGAGRLFPLDALPADARADLLHRRLMAEAARNAGSEGKPRAPLAALAEMKARQAERHTARSLVLELFDRFRGDRSARASLDAFVAAYNEGRLDVPAWARADVERASVKTMKRWLAARAAGEDEALAGRYRGGRRSVFVRSTEAAQFVVGAHAAQPLLGAEELHGLLATQFPQGLPDETGVLIELPSVDTVERFVRSWRDDAANAAALVAFTDPDRFRSHFRFAPGDAAAGIARPNQLWQIDASPTDVMCQFLDGTVRRFTIYIVVDVATRRLLSLVSDTARTAASLLLIARAIQRWGIPETIGTDNGSDFISQHFCLTLRQIGVHHQIAPPFSPDRKPFVERAIGSVNHKFMRLMPGFIGHSVADRKQIEARRSFAQRLGEGDRPFDQVALSAPELADRLAAWIDNVYSLRPHAGLGGRTPHDVSLELLAAHPPRFADERAIGMLLMPPAESGGTRVVTKKGVAVGNIDYWCDRLIPGQRLQVRLDPADAGRIWLYTDTDPMRFVGIALNPELAGLDRAELAARIRGEQQVRDRDGRARLRRLVKQANIHDVAARMLGNVVELPVAPTATPDHTTPALEAALRAADHGDAASATVAVLADRRARRATDETADDRYARAKELRSLIEAGAQIPADSRAWLEAYEQGPEFKGLRRVDDLPS